MSSAGGISAAQYVALHMLANGMRRPPGHLQRVRRNPLHASTVRSLEVAGLIRWEKTEDRTGWVPTARGRLVLDQIAEGAGQAT